MPRRVRKSSRIVPRRVRAGVRNRKKTPFKLIFINPRSSIKPGSAHDPKIDMGNP